MYCFCTAVHEYMWRMLITSSHSHPYLWFDSMSTFSSNQYISNHGCFLKMIDQIVEKSLPSFPTRVCTFYQWSTRTGPQVLILVNLRSPCLQGMLAGSSHESLDGRASLPRMKSYDAVVFDTLRVSPEDFAVSTCMNTLFYSRYAFQEICLS